MYPHLPGLGCWGVWLGSLELICGHQDLTVQLETVVSATREATSEIIGFIPFPYTEGQTGAQMDLVGGQAEHALACSGQADITQVGSSTVQLHLGSPGFWCSSSSSVLQVRAAVVLQAAGFYHSRAGGPCCSVELYAGDLRFGLSQFLLEASSGQWADF